MPNCKYDWPEASERRLIGKRIKRIDGPAKASGRAKYTFDINRPGMLFAKVLRSPYAHATVKSIDTSEAEKLPGVKAVRVIKGAGKEVQWQGDEVAAVAAERAVVDEDQVAADAEARPPAQVGDRAAGEACALERDKRAAGLG